MGREEGRRGREGGGGGRGGTRGRGGGGSEAGDLFDRRAVGKPEGEVVKNCSFVFQNRIFFDLRGRRGSRRGRGGRGGRGRGKVFFFEISLGAAHTGGKGRKRNRGFTRRLLKGNNKVGRTRNG